ncbi:MAG: DNA polymerase III subunit beta, partial [Campylobacterales bacterium]|nr:DNA polymerase III subunit beta [Campylobacterales bacterium]
LDVHENEINLVATDTRRLAIVTMQNEAKTKFNLIIPKKAIVEIQKFFFDESELYFDNVNLIIKSKNQTFFTKLINGKYPDYQRIIPKNIKYSLTLSRDRFISEIKLINAVSNDLKITFSKETVTFENLNEDSSQAKSEMEYSADIDYDLTIAVSSRYLLDYLQQCETKEFVIGINEPNLPFVLNSGNYKTVIMPIIL